MFEVYRAAKTKTLSGEAHKREICDLTRLHNCFYWFVRHEMLCWRSLETML